jgi:integrase/recombinase XerD
VLSPEEMRHLLAAAPGFKYRLLLSLTYGCGLSASEVVSLKVSKIDSAQMVIRIERRQIAIERAAPSVPHLPRLRALQVCRPGRWCVAAPVTAGIRNKPLQQRKCNPQAMSYVVGRML